MGNVQNWSRVLCTTERVLNNSVKQPPGVSSNTLLFGNAFSVDRTLLTQIDQAVTDVKPRSTQDFVDTLIPRHAQVIDAAIHPQTAINEAKLRRLETEVDDHSGTTEPFPVSFIAVGTRTPRQPILAATKWIQVWNPFSGSLTV